MDEPTRQRFDEVFRAHHRRLVSMLCRRTGDPEAAQDLAQETLIRAFRHLDRFDEAGPVWPWLRAIAMNRAATWASRKQCTVPLNGVDRAAESTDLQQVESRETLDALMVDLTTPQRRALWLRYVEDQDSRRAAATLGVSVPAFKQLLHRARSRLRVRLEGVRDSVLAPALIPVRALQRFLVRGGRNRSTGSVQRLAEALTPLGTAAIALLFVLGGGAVQPASGGPLPPATSWAPVPSTDVRQAPGGVRHPAILAPRPRVIPADARAGSRSKPKVDCVGGQACIQHGDVPQPPPSVKGVNPRIPPAIRADVYGVGEGCTQVGCLIENENPDPGPTPIDLGPAVRPPRVIP